MSDPVCAPVRKLVREIHTRSGVPLVTYVSATCACGEELVIEQDGHGHQLRDDGFDVSEEIADARKHFGFAMGKARALPVGSVTKVCVDPLPGPAWTVHALDAALVAEVPRRTFILPVTPPPPSFVVAADPPGVAPLTPEELEAAALDFAPVENWQFDDE